MRKICIGLLATALWTGCAKDFLDTKRNSNQVVPSKISDYQALLDYNETMNNKASFELSIIGSDEYVLSDEAWNGANPLYYTHVKNGYIWADEVYEAKEVNDWNRAYERIMYSNLALDVEQIEPNGEEQRIEWNNVRGQALFHRAYTFYQLAQEFCRPYDPHTADSDPGIPLRVDYDLSVTYGRGTVREVYARIVDDLKAAAELMPERQVNNYRPSRLAAYALLARVCREMDIWDECLYYANKVLMVKNDLLDYNSFLDGELYTFDGLNRGLDNPEILFYCHTSSGYIMTNGRVPEYWLKEVFSEGDDLRKALFFKDGKLFYGSYAGYNHFTGITVGEILLIRAEAYLNVGDINSAKADMDYLRRNRFAKGKYKAITATDLNDVQKLLAMERERELYMRGTRWADLRKLNLNKESARSLVRTVNGVQYRLDPNDPKWVWPIPDNEIAGSGIEQNDR